MQRHEASFPELGAADRQHRRVQIDILKLEIAGFAKAKAGNAQQSKQTMIDPRSQLAALPATRHPESRVQ
jgi:hypothetical protein